MLRVARAPDPARGAVGGEADRGRGGAGDRGGGRRRDRRRGLRLAELLALELGIALVGEGLAGSPRCSRACSAICSPTASASRSWGTPLRSTWSSSRTRILRPPGARPPADRGPHRAVHPAAGDAAGLLTLVTLAVALAVYVPWLLVLLVVAVLPCFLGETHFASLGYSLLYSVDARAAPARLSPLRRRERQTAKEVKLFGLADFLVGRYDGLSHGFYDANRRLAMRRSLVVARCSRCSAPWATTAPTPHHLSGRAPVAAGHSPSARSPSSPARSARAAI